MARTSNYLAFDLGAESGRAVVGRFDGSVVQLETLHRFPNGPVRIFDHLHWDVLRLWTELKMGLSAYRAACGAELDGIGLDTWGVDFALLDAHDELLGTPYHYRDVRTEGMMAAAMERVPRAEIFATTGIQFMDINTLYQLLAMRQQGSPLLDAARAFLMIPDLFNYWLTGTKASEFSIATTTQFYDPRAGDWAWNLLERLDIPVGILPRVIQPGEQLGTLHPLVAAETGMSDVPVIAPACHDTGSAVAAVPATGDSFAYLSSGTWSLMGVETRQPVINDDSLAFNFTNEGGVSGTIRLLKNIMGLWLLQECRRTWAAQGRDWGYDDLTQLAAAAPAFGALVEPDHHDFLRPGDMPTLLCDFCQRTGQQAPRSEGEIVRCILESLALKYRWTLDKLERMQGRRLDTIHVVGGGSQNRLLCQLTADATQRVVVAGPVEATATGNVLLQAISRGELASLQEAREVVRASFDLTTYHPGPAAPWDDAYERFLHLMEQTA
ncbi:MAG: rhamnulokinase [Chloroflexi bacterium]|nr:rhamnulokinase [Chloroflexota bacterium]